MTIDSKSVIRRLQWQNPAKDKGKVEIQVDVLREAPDTAMVVEEVMGKEDRVRDV